MSFQFFWNEADRAKIEKMRLQFLVWNEKVNKKMEEHMRKIESFSPPCPRSSMPIIAHNTYLTGYHYQEEEKSY
jgi:hypothetical protein